MIAKSLLYEKFSSYYKKMISDEETVEYPMGVRQSATILFPETNDKKFREKETGTLKQAIKAFSIM